MQKKSMKKILESGSAKGISDELYEMAWNGREKEQAKPETISRRNIFRHLKFVDSISRERIYYILERKRKEIL